MRWILQLEDERQVRAGGGDLIALLADPEARIRRRAALALGRVKLPEAIPALTSMLQSEPDAEVKQMAAFAMGLIGDAAAATALTAALSDTDPLIQGRAAEALGMIAHKAAAPAVAAMVSAHINAGALNGITPDDMAHPKPPAAEAVRLGLYALVRLGSYDAHCRFGARCRWPSAQPVVASRIRVAARQRCARGAGAARAAEGRGTADARLCRARARTVEGSARRRRRCCAIVENAGDPIAVRIQAVRGAGPDGRPERRGGDAAADRVAEGRPEPAARGGDRPRAAAQRRVRRVADRSRLRGVAVGARRRARMRWRAPTSTHSSARSPASIPIRTGRCARRWPPRSATWDANARRRR